MPTPGFSQEADTLIDLEGVEVREVEKRPEPFQVDILKKREIYETAVRDAGDILRKVPNVSGIRKGGIGLDPVVRGFKYSQLNVQLNNGHKIEGGCPNRMDPAMSHIDVDDIAAMEVIKGPFALRYGPNFGGVINVLTVRPAPADKLSFHVKAMQGFESNWNGSKQHLALYGGNGDIFFRLMGNYKKYGDYEDGNGNTVSSHFTRYNYSAAFGAVPWKGHELILSFEDSHGRNVMYPSLPMDERTDDTRLMSLDYTIDDLSGTFRELNLKCYHSAVSHAMDNKERPFSDTVVAVSEIDAINMGYRLEGRFSLGRGHLWVGTDLEDIRKDGARVKTRILEPTMPVMKENLWANAHIRDYGFFTEFRRTFNALELVAAARVDLNAARSDDLRLEKMGNLVFFDGETGSDFTNFSASLGGTCHLTGDIDLSLSFGRGMRSADMVERFIILLPIGYDNYDYLGNPQLKPEINYEADLGAQINRENSGVLNLNGFFSYVEDYITGRYLPPSVVKPQTKGVLGVKEFYNEDRVFLWGWEVSYRSPAMYRWGVRFHAARTCGVNPGAKKYVFDEGNLVGVTSLENDPLSEIPPLEANLTFRYTFLDNAVIPKVSVRAVGRQDRASEAFNEPETPGFITASAGLSWRFNRYFTATGGVNNIFDKAYYEHLNRRIVGGGGNLYEPGRIFYVNLIFSV